MPTRRKGSRRGEPGAAPSPGTRDELAGYLEGLAHRLDHVDLPEGERRTVRDALASAARALAARDLATADRVLREAEERMDAFDEETELVERPRGLVGFVPTGSPGRPPGVDEEPLANRMLLIERLWHVRRADGYDVESLREPLARAAAAYRAGDRERARRLIDEVHSALESAVRRPPSSPGG